MARRDQRNKLERLCRYICRPAVSEKRLAMTPGRRIRYQLKTPYRDGTTHVFFQPLDFIARLAASVPKQRVNLTRFYGVLAPNSKHQSPVTIKYVIPEGRSPPQCNLFSRFFERRG